MRRGATSRAVVIAAIVALVLSACGGGGSGHHAAPSNGANGAGAGSGHGGSGESGGDSGSSDTGGASTADAELTMSISGHMSNHDRVDAPHGYTEESMTLDWSVTVTGTQDDIVSGKAVPKITRMSGTTSWSGTSDQGLLSCSGGLHAAPNPDQSELQALLFIEPPDDPNPSVNYNQGVGPQNTQGSDDYLLEGGMPGKIVVSDNTNPHESQCNTGPAGDFPTPDQGTAQYKEFAKAAFPVAIVHPDGSVENPSSSYSYSGPIAAPPGSTAKAEQSLSTTLTWGGCHVDVTPASNTAYDARRTPDVELDAYKADNTSGGSICPYITWNNAPGGPKPLLDGDTKTVEAGELIDLTAGYNGRDAADNDHVSWSVNGRVVKNYVMEDANAHEVPLEDADRALPSIKFYWTSAGGAGSGSAGAARQSNQKVRMTVKGKSVNVTFTVKTPEWKEFHANTCPSGIDTDPSISERSPNSSPGTKLPIFGLGFVNVPSALCAHTPGIKWSYEVIGTGQMAMTQLINDQMLHNDKPCATKTPSGYGADNSRFYGGQHNGGSYNTNDSPGFSLAGESGSFERRFYAHDYLMYKPEKPGSIWIPLAYMDWNFIERVSQGSAGWKIDSKHDPIDKIDGSTWDEEPTWTFADTNKNGFNCN